MLRTRLFLSLLPFVVMLLGMGIYAITLFSRMAQSFDVAVAGHYQNIFAAYSMGQALSGMDREIRYGALTRPSETNLLFTYQQRFEDNLALQRQNVVPAGVQELTVQLESEYQGFLRSLEGRDYVRAPKDQLRDQQQLSASLAKMNSLLEKIRDQNYQAVLGTSQNIQQTTREVTRLIIIGIFIVLVISVYTCLQLSRSILQPIQMLTRATGELGKGNPAPPVPVVSRDELGALAISFNQMAAQLEEYRQSTSDEIMRLHRTMETTLASFPDPIFVLNRAGQIELKNPAADELAESLQLNGTLPEPLQTIADKALASGRNFLPHSFDEAVSYRIHGAEKSFLPRILAMHGRDNAGTGVAIVLYDVTRFRLMDSAKTNLVATVSHELNTPLTSIRMALHLLLEQSVGELTPQQDELLQTARNDTERLLRILNDLLDLARLEQGSEGLRKEEVAPASLLHSVVEENSDKAAARGLRLQCRIARNLPPVAVDRQRISHVFNNLVANAIKYSPPGGQILLSADAAEDDNIEFGVRDEGPGIPEEYQARIFERFFRAPGQTKTGAGLGLSIAREIATAHGGRLGLRSSPGHGSTFLVTLKATASVGASL
jgi:NtrC-family two-component system sensor histidine kinase KinB